MESEFRPDIELAITPQEPVILSANPDLEAQEHIQDTEPFIQVLEDIEASLEVEKEKNEAEEVDLEPELETEIDGEAEAENPLLDEGFASFEAQFAYYAFIEASNGLTSGTAEAAQIYIEAMDSLDEYMHELSIGRQLSVILVMFKSIIVLLSVRARQAFTTHLSEALMLNMQEDFIFQK